MQEDSEHPDHGHRHSHGLIDDSIKLAATGSVALLADSIHNFGDASTAIPLAIAFLLGSRRVERWAGLFVIAAIFLSACVVAVEAYLDCSSPRPPLIRLLWPSPG